MPSTPPDPPVAFDLVVLDDDGVLLHHGQRVPQHDLDLRLRDLVDIPAGTTDIFVFVHGWQNDEDRTVGTANTLFGGIERRHRDCPERYPQLASFQPHFIAVHWPSTSLPVPQDYRMIRDRAHAMTSTGHAAEVVGALLGYLDAVREKPDGPDVLATAGGQYLHGVAHSFGGRMLGEAITWAADPPEPPVMTWPWSSRHPFTVDSLVVFQMAAPPRFLTEHFVSLADGDAPIHGPVVLTVSEHDSALSTWHRHIEGEPGIGAVGAQDAPTLRLRPADEDYSVADFSRVTNIDASWRFRDGPRLAQGAHCDIWHVESFHLLLSVANLSR